MSPCARARLTVCIRVYVCGVVVLHVMELVVVVARTTCNRERQTCHAYAITVSRLLLQSFRRSQSDYYYILRSQFKRQKICCLFASSLLGFAPPYTTQPTIQKNNKQTSIHQQVGQTTVRIQKIKTKIKHTSVLGNTFNNRCK